MINNIKFVNTDIDVDLKYTFVLRRPGNLGDKQRFQVALTISIVSQVKGV